MRLHGEFHNRIGRLIGVDITTDDGTDIDLEIGRDGAGVWFDGQDAVVITGEAEDGFDVMCRHSCTIRLQTRQWLEGLFVSDVRDSRVRIYEMGVCIFAGYIEPQTYSQDYNLVFDTLELNCIDAIGALQYRRWKDVGSRGVSYDEVKAAARQLTLSEVLYEILPYEHQNGGELWQMLYDGSKSVRSGEGYEDDEWKYTLFDDITISERRFLGQTEDDVWTCEEILEHILKYADLHIMQEGLMYYIFSWESFASGVVCAWRWVGDSGKVRLTTRPEMITIGNGNVADTATTLTVDECFNQILLTVKPEDDGNVVESPLDKDRLTACWNRMQKWLTEYSSDGEGERARRALWDMCHGGSTGWSGAWSTDWYVRVLEAAGWHFTSRGIVDVWQTDGRVSMWDADLGDLYDELCTDDDGQHALPEWLGVNAGGVIAGFGKVKKTYGDNGDNSPTSSVRMENALYLKARRAGTPLTSDEVIERIPWVVYKGDNLTGVYSPADDGMVNYIVFSGQIVLNPVMGMSLMWNDASSQRWGRGATTYRTSAGEVQRLGTVSSASHKDGRFYTRRYYKSAVGGEDETDNAAASGWGLIPFTDEATPLLKYEYNSEWKKEDVLSKVPVLVCMLVIGDKCVVETGNSGTPDDFEWRTYKERSACQSDEEYFAQSFTIGIDPKIDECLIGKQYDMQNNISYQLNIDAEGTAIPIRRQDKVSGGVRFAILCPADTVWESVLSKTNFFLKSTKYTGTRILDKTDSIIIKDFQVRTFSDSGGNDPLTENDIVYMSDADIAFSRRKDDVEMKIHSALTAAECAELGVVSTVASSTAQNALTEVGNLEMTNTLTGERQKPEKLYVDAHWRERHVPRLKLKQCLRDDGTAVKQWSQFWHPALGKIFYTFTRERNLQAGETTVIMKETWN